jgi:hypothetical protein
MIIQILIYLFPSINILNFAYTNSKYLFKVNVQQPLYSKSPCEEDVSRLFSLCDNAWSNLIKGKVKNVKSNLFSDERNNEIFDQIANFISVYNDNSSTLAWGINTNRLDSGQPINTLRSDSNSNVDNSRYFNSNNPQNNVCKLHGTWRIRYSSNAEDIRRAIKYKDHDMIENFNSLKNEIVSSVIFSKESTGRKELRKTREYIAMSDVRLSYRLKEIFLEFKPGVKFPGMHLSIPKILNNIYKLPNYLMKRYDYFDILYLDEDIMITKNLDNHFAIRSKVYQTWDPGAANGWVYVSVV